MVAESSTPTGPVEIFYSYAHEDEALRQELENHLSLLKRQGVITDWHDRKILPGDEWKGQIDQHLTSARIVLLLVSQHFIASDYCYDREMIWALERQEGGATRVIPIILSPIEDGWRTAPFGTLQALPKDAKPITTWDRQDEAFADVVNGIRRAIHGQPIANESSPPPAEPAPDLPVLRQGATTWVLSLLKRVLGPRLGSAVFLLLFLLGAAWWNWETLKTRPGIQWVVARLTQPAVQPVVASKFLVAVALLEDDPNNGQRELVLNALNGFTGIEVTDQVTRLIAPTGLTESAKEQMGHEQARVYLRTLNAQVLIWGKVLTQGSQKAPQLYLTTSEAKQRAREVTQLDNFKLPALFWHDLVDILRLAVLAQGNEFIDKQGTFLADQLAPFIEKVRTLLAEASQQHGWEQDTRAQVNVILGNALLTLGEQSGKNEPLTEAVVAYRAALQEYTRERVPLQWAMTQTNLGNALRTLVQRPDEIC